MLIEASPYGQMAEKQAEHERGVTDVEATKCRRHTCLLLRHASEGGLLDRRKWSIEAPLNRV